MRLLNTTTLEFQKFLGRIPPYAILSHRWSAEEVSYADYVLTRRPLEQLPPYLQDEVAAIKRRTGYCKILDFAAIVTEPRGDIHWCWVDTCCIDKSSSAELSEAINSMWAWYRDRAWCSVYLSDVLTSRNVSLDRQAIMASKWWKRCWTLQEFLAPEILLFYDRDRNPFMEVVRDYLKGGASWWSELEDAAADLACFTRIPAECITKPADAWLYDQPIANRMSWVSDRSATRVEDIAYSLMGLFDVNMPLLYGEGSLRSSPARDSPQWIR